MDLSGEPTDCWRLPEDGRGHPAFDEAMTASEKDAEGYREEHEPPESGDKNRCNPRPPEDRQLLELLELQRRMFQSGCCD
jgi:hypothetical protein